MSNPAKNKKPATYPMRNAFFQFSTPSSATNNGTNPIHASGKKFTLGKLQNNSIPELAANRYLYRFTKLKMTSTGGNIF